MAQPTYREVKRSQSTSSFGMNEVSFMRFTDMKHYHLTEGLNACFGLFLFSPLASVSAHLPPHPGTESTDPRAGDQNLIGKMREFCNLYAAKREYFDDYNVCLVFARFHGKTALPDKKEFIEKCLQTLGLKFVLQDYDVKLPGPPRREHDGTAFVHGTPSLAAILYLEDKPAARANATGRASLLAAGTTRHADPAGSAPVQNPTGRASLSAAGTTRHVDPAGSAPVRNPNALFPRHVSGQEGLGGATSAQQSTNETPAARHIESTGGDSPATRSAPSKEPQTSRHAHVSARDSHLSTSMPAQRGDLHPSASKSDTKTASTKKPPTYVKSTFVNGKKVVIIENRYVSVRDDDWTPRPSSMGKQILFCERHNLWTDL